MSEAQDPSIAAAHGLYLAELAARWGVSKADLFEGTGLDVAALTAPRARLSLTTMGVLFQRATALTGEPGLGFYMGLQMRISSHGALGLAAMAAPTLGEALELAIRFMPTRTDALALRLETHEGKASLYLDELCPLGVGREALVFSLLVGLHQMGTALTGKRIDDTADAAFPEPDYVARFQHLTGGRMRFDREAHRLIFPAAALDYPVLHADPVALELGREQCQRELDDLGFQRKVAARVRALLPKEPLGFRSLEEAAALLGVSTRTLKRSLASEGTEFSAILDDLRKARALSLLRSPELTLAEVAERCGYSDVPNFTRAFRRWTGTSPAAHRKKG